MSKLTKVHKLNDYYVFLVIRGQLQLHRVKPRLLSFKRFQVFLIKMNAIFIEKLWV